MIDELPVEIKESSCLLFADELELLRLMKDIDDDNVLEGEFKKVMKWRKDN